MEFAKQPQIKTSVVACIIDEQERILLTRRCIEPFCSQWVMPGGKIDHGEPILEALHREVQEEVGIAVRVEGLIDVFERLGIGERNDHFIILYYRCAPLTFELQPNGSECTEARWVGRQELSTLSIPAGTRHILGKIYPGVFPDADVPPAAAVENEIPGGSFPAP